MKVKKILIYIVLLLVTVASVIVIVEGLSGSWENSLINRVFRLGIEKFNPAKHRQTLILPKRITLLFAGDLMQHSPQVEAAWQGGDYNYDDCFSHIAPLLRESDIAVVNLETTLSEIPPYSGYPRFKSPAQLAAAIKNAGVDAVLLANNHICDRGATGLRATVDAVEKNGLLYTGAFADSTAMHRNNPLIIERRGITVSILNYTYGTNGLPVPNGMAVNLIDTVQIASDLADRPPEHFNVVCIHWGNEYQIPQSSRQEELARWLHERGADLVIGSHPHVVQQLFVSRDSAGNISGATVYSLGNFVSNQTSPIGTEGGMVVRFVIEEGRPEATLRESASNAPYVSRRAGPQRGILYENTAKTGLQNGRKVSIESWANLVIGAQGDRTMNCDRRARVGPKIVSAENFYVWSHKPVVDGHRKYIIVPSYMAGELLSEETAVQARYGNFIDSVRKTVGNASGFTELTSAVEN